MNSMRVFCPVLVFVDPSAFQLPFSAAAEALGISKTIPSAILKTVSTLVADLIIGLMVLVSF
jgi:hypothetical protein